jgi:hypothetical protein
VKTGNFHINLRFTYIHFQKQQAMSGRGKVAGSGKARAKAKTRSSKAGLQFPVVCIIFDLFHIE